MKSERLIREKMRKRFDALVMGTVTNAIPPADQEPLTVDALRRMALTMPPKETWLSTRLFPGAEAIRIEGSGENFLVAHPMFWARLVDHCRKAQYSPIDLSHGFPPFCGIQITEIDPSDDDSYARTMHLRGIWERLTEAVKVASVPLPEWLKAAPKFGTHG